jgi:hypothetical protein
VQSAPQRIQTELESAGRPDLALVVLKAQEALSA